MNSRPRKRRKVKKVDHSIVDYPWMVEFCMNVSACACFGDGTYSSSARLALLAVSLALLLPAAGGCWEVGAAYRELT